MIEIHITTKKLQQKGIDEFVEFCALIKAKPIIIELEDGKVIQQPMISKIVEVQNIYEVLDKLKYQFSEHNYPISRVKIEVPTESINDGEKLFPDFKGKYFEWHGKVIFQDLNHLKNSVGKRKNVHLSSNSLKGESNKRFITLRSFGHLDSFKYEVEDLKRSLKFFKYEIIKDEFEYCIYDSNKDLDSGWIDIPEITDRNYLNLLAFEGFLRRAIHFNDKFVLKGSLLTRQYIKEKGTRLPNDLDFIYSKVIENHEDAAKIFSSWVTQITELELNDGIKFRSFRENDFWRGVDYAMNDDFPTTNTDLKCYINDTVLDLSLDISWNLPLDEEMVELEYHPLIGSSFTIQKTIPLSLQISWKLHQTIVGPRTKDLIDIILMIDNNILTEEQIKRIAFHLTNECRKDRIPINRVSFYTNHEVSKFYPEVESDIDVGYNTFKAVPTKFGFDFSNFFTFGVVKKDYTKDFEYSNMIDVIFDFEEKLINLGLTNYLKEYSH